ncbi:hypothetical protein SAMN05216311_111169 [Chitinophaga sp. CF418]|nr:hypothetical protein SAMN05216311_111169 [Chitinophaga sp. CF418]
MKVEVPNNQTFGLRLSTSPYHKECDGRYVQRYIKKTVPIIIETASSCFINSVILSYHHFSYHGFSQHFIYQFDNTVFRIAQLLFQWSYSGSDV